MNMTLNRQLARTRAGSEHLIRAKEGPSWGKSVQLLAVGQGRNIGVPAINFLTNFYCFGILMMTCIDCPKKWQTVKQSTGGE